MTSFATKPEEKIEVYKIAVKMHEASVPSALIADIVPVALEYEGALELMKLWAQEVDAAEKDEIIADLQEEVERLKEAPERRFRAPRIDFDDLDKTAAAVLKFKRELRDIVDRWGGVSKLARATGIPQPSLSRFFSSPSLPRNTTVYRIVQALLPEEAEFAWVWEAPISLGQLNAMICAKQNEHRRE